jgi:hypothetical protein
MNLTPMSALIMLAIWLFVGSFFASVMFATEEVCTPDDDNVVTFDPVL